jgi:DNA-binding transcriptional ArsR family regulator
MSPRPQRLDPRNISKSSLDTTTPIHYRMVVDELSLTFAALSDPTRRAMVQKLTLGPATIHALTQPFELSQQMISKHVVCLVRAHIVVKQKRGRESVCSLSPAAIKSVADWAIDFRRFWEESLDKLDAVLHEMKNEETNRARTSHAKPRCAGPRHSRRRRQ